MLAKKMHMCITVLEYARRSFDGDHARMPVRIALLLLPLSKFTLFALKVILGSIRYLRDRAERVRYN